MAKTLKERIATLEEQNDAAKPLHAEFRDDIKALKAGQVEIQTTLKLLVTNGHQKTIAWAEKAKSSVVPLGSGGGVIGLVWFLLEKFQTG